MRRVIAISFLVLANIIILAHAVVYHHHYIPVAWTDIHHEHDCNLPDHYHDDTQPIGHCNDSNCLGDVEDCLLTAIYVKLNNNRRSIQLLDFDLFPYSLFSFSNYSISQVEDDTNLPFRQKPYLISYLTEYISQSHGLRAPPIC